MVMIGSVMIGSVVVVVGNTPPAIANAALEMDAFASQQLSTTGNNK
jgi:hypothetical protein